MYICGGINIYIYIKLIRLFSLIYKGYFLIFEVSYEIHIWTWHFSCLFNLHVLTVEKVAWLFLRRVKKDELCSISICIRARVTGRAQSSQASESFCVQQQELPPTISFCLVWKGRENHQIAWIEGTFLLNHLLGEINWAVEHDSSIGEIIKRKLPPLGKSHRWVPELFWESWLLHDKNIIAPYCHIAL